MDNARTLTRNRRASAAYRARLRDASAPTARDLAALLLDAYVAAAAKGRAAPDDKVVAALVERGFDADASTRLLAGLVARRAETTAATRQC